MEIKNQVFKFSLTSTHLAKNFMMEIQMTVITLGPRTTEQMRKI